MSDSVCVTFVNIGHTLAKIKNRQIMTNNVDFDICHRIAKSSLRKLYYMILTYFLKNKNCKCYLL